MADINRIATEFTEYYYGLFSGDRTFLRPLYRDNSMLTWEGSPIQGVGSIIDKLSTLPFTKVEHKVTTLDAQPSNPAVASLIVLVTGLLVVDGGPHALQYTQTFQLIPEGGSYYIYNEVFRLNYG